MVNNSIILSGWHLLDKINQSTENEKERSRNLLTTTLNSYLIVVFSKVNLKNLRDSSSELFKNNKQ